MWMMQYKHVILTGHFIRIQYYNSAINFYKVIRRGFILNIVASMIPASTVAWLDLQLGNEEK